jgi:hypothetical protein
MMDQDLQQLACPYPKDHWIYQKHHVPPMDLRMGEGDLLHLTILSDIPNIAPRGMMVINKKQAAGLINAAGRYAIRASTMNGREIDFDPDAMLQNLVVAFLGYWTHDGLDHDNPEFNPVPIKAE